MSSNIIISNKKIDDLICCHKYFKSPPKKPGQVNKNMSQKFSVFSKDKDEEFTIFITSSIRMTQDFSLGLMYKNLLLFRCNGYHGTTKSGFYSAEHHAYPHAHVLTELDILEGRGKMPSMICDLTGEFVNLQTATLYFFEKCRIINYEKYFDIQQLSLFEYQN